MFDVGSKTQRLNKGKQQKQDHGLLGGSLSAKKQ